MAHDIDHAQGFIDAPAEHEVVHELVLDHPFFVDDEQTAEGDHRTVGMELVVFVVLVFAEEDIVICGDALVEVGHHREVDGADAALVGRQPREDLVGFDRIGGDRNNSGFARFKFSEALVESNQFRRADPRKVLGVEEQQDVLLTEVGGEGEVVLDLALNQCRRREIRRRMPHEN